MWSPLQLYSVCERLKTPCPPLNTDDKKYDFTNVVDACCNLTRLKLTGSRENIGNSQMVPNELKIDFLPFKCLTQLHLEDLDIGPQNITSLGILRNTLQILFAPLCNLSSVSQLLLCDVTCSEDDISSIIPTPSYSWTNLLKLDLR